MRGVAAGVIEMEVGVDHPPHVARKEPGGGERVLQLGGAFQPAVLDAVDVEELAVLLVAERRCRSAPGPSGCSTSRHRIASGMRFRSSGATRVFQSVRGTTPNMAPPSSRCRPPSSVWQRSRPTVNAACESVTGSAFRAGVRRRLGGHGHAGGAGAPTVRRASMARDPAACGRPPRAPASAAGPADPP